MKTDQPCRNKNSLNPCQCNFRDKRRQWQRQWQFQRQGQKQDKSQWQGQNFNSLLTNFLLNLKLSIAKILKLNSNKKIDSNFSFIFYYNRRYRWKIQRRLIHYDLKPKMFLDHYHFWQKIS